MSCHEPPPIKHELEHRALDTWLSEAVTREPAVSHTGALEALDAARADFGQRRD